MNLSTLSTAGILPFSLEIQAEASDRCVFIAIMGGKELKGFLKETIYGILLYVLKRL